MSNPIEQIKNRMKADAPIKWLFAGDSVTHGALHTWGSRDYTEHFSERLRWELCRQRDLIIKTGASGATAQTIRDDIEWSVLQFNPDVVALMIGINDCCISRGGGLDGLHRFHDNVLFLIDRIQAANRETAIILQTSNPIWSEATDRENLPLYAAELRRIAEERDLFLVDHYNYWQNAIKETPIRTTVWMNDSLHPSHYGHLAMAQLLLQKLDLWDSSSDVCRLFLP